MIFEIFIMKFPYRTKFYIALADSLHLVDAETLPLRKF